MKRSYESNTRNSESSDIKKNNSAPARRTLESHGIPFKPKEINIENGDNLEEYSSTDCNSSSSKSSQNQFHEYNSQNRIDKEIESSSDPSESSEIDSPVLKKQDVEYSYVPTTVEKQIIRHSFAMICRSNMSDWNYELGKNCKTMVLHENCIAVDEPVNCCKGDTQNQASVYEVINEVSYETDAVYCRVLYRNLDIKEKNYTIVFYIWNNNVGDRTIEFLQYDTQRYYLVFSRPIEKRLSLVPKESFEDSWCYFDDARRHLMKISF